MKFRCRVQHDWDLNALWDVTEDKCQKKNKTKQVLYDSTGMRYLEQSNSYRQKREQQLPRSEERKAWEVTLK